MKFIQFYTFAFLISVPTAAGSLHMQLHIILFSVSKSHEHEHEHEDLPGVWLVISFNEMQTRRIRNAIQGF